MYDVVMEAARKIRQPTAAVSAGAWPQEEDLDYDLVEGDEYMEAQQGEQAFMPEPEEEGQFEDDYAPEDLAGCVHTYILPQGYWSQEEESEGETYMPAAAAASAFPTPQLLHSDTPELPKDARSVGPTQRQPAPSLDLPD